jgi:hypothetical protein
MPLPADDRFAILDLLAGANWAADAKNVEATASHYTADGYIDGAFTARPGADFRPDLEKMYEGEGTLKRHALINPLIEGGGDAATVTWMMPVFEGEIEPALVATCRVTDRLVRQHDRWLIRHHTVEIDPSMKADVGQNR